MNIEKLSLVELTKLNERITAALPIVRARELTAARKEVEVLIAARGYSLAELVGTAGKGRRALSKPAGAPRKPSTKLRDGKGVIWAGRGRMPKNFDKASAVAVF